MSDGVLNQPSKFRTKNWVEINDESRAVYTTGSDIKFKTTMLRSSLCDYSDAYILVKGNISVSNSAAADADANNTNKNVVFKICASLIECISKINNTDIDNAQDIDITYCWLLIIEDIVDFNGANSTDSLNFKSKVTGQTDNNGRIDNFQIMVPLKCLSNFWRILEMPLINCEIILIFTWSANCVIMYTNVANHGATFGVAT